MWTTSALGFKLWCGGEKERLAQQLPVMSAYVSNTMQQASEEDKRKICALLCRCFLWHEVDSEEKNKCIIIE